MNNHEAEQQRPVCECGSQRALEQRQAAVQWHEAEAARLQGEVSRGDMSKLFEYSKALTNLQAAELGVKPPEPKSYWQENTLFPRVDHNVEPFPDLKHVDTPPCPPVEPQAQVNAAYLEYLTARKATLETAIRSACYYLSIHEPTRAYDLLNQSLTQ